MMYLVFKLQPSIHSGADAGFGPARHAALGHAPGSDAVCEVKIRGLKTRIPRRR
jgi:hypothetical protein